MPLNKGDLPASPLTARIIAVPFPGGCLESPADLEKWFRGFQVEFNFQTVAFAYTAGTVAMATANDQTLPRLLFDDLGRFIGMAVWDTNVGGWTTGSRVGELKTIVRTENTLEEDMEKKNLSGAGWYLADGSQIPIPDYTSKPGFLEGSGPDYSVYTVGYFGN